MTEPGAIALAASARRVGAEVEVVLEATIPPNSHIEPHEPAEPFLIPTVVEVEGLDQGTVVYPPPHEKDIGIPGAISSVYEGNVTFVARGKARSDESAVSGTIRYQPCVGGACLPPRTLRWEASVVDERNPVELGGA